MEISNLNPNEMIPLTLQFKIYTKIIHYLNFLNIKLWTVIGENTENKNISNGNESYLNLLLTAWMLFQMRYLIFSIAVRLFFFGDKLKLIISKVLDQSFMGKFSCSPFCFVGIKYSFEFLIFIYLGKPWFLLTNRALSVLFNILYQALFLKTVPTQKLCRLLHYFMSDWTNKLRSLLFLLIFFIPRL